VASTNASSIDTVYFYDSNKAGVTANNDGLRTTITLCDGHFGLIYDIEWIAFKDGLLLVPVT